MKLNKEELQNLINIVGQVSVPVNQSPALVALINKMSKILDELAEAEKPKIKKP